MLKKLVMKKISLFLLLCFFGMNFYSQDNTIIEPAKNVIHGSMGTIVAAFSAQLTYDRLVKQSDNGFFTSYYATIKGGRHVAIDFSGNNGGTGYVTSIGATALTGKGKNHFEVGLGLGYFIDTENLIDEGDPEEDVDESTFYPNITVGYRKQTTNGFVFRTGFGVVEWAHVGIGFSF